MRFRSILIAAVLFPILGITVFLLPQTHSVDPVVLAQISKESDRIVNDSRSNPLTMATFGTGCFWCTEAIFANLPGVQNAVSGYSGGETMNPSYQEICGGQTGHAEVVQIQFDPTIISYRDLLRAFWQSHDPTTLNRQGNDVGSQYRSVIFYHSPAQQEIANFFKNELNRQNAFGATVKTEITPFHRFFKAESTHQDYFANNPGKAYCRFVISPKIEHFKKAFQQKIR